MLALTVVVVLCGAVCGGTARVGHAARDRAVADAAADLVALAAVTGGDDGAARVAAANAATVTDLTRVADGTVVVTVRAAGATARAAAAPAG